MPTFTSSLVPGSKRPYDTWTFITVPDEVMAALGSKRPYVQGTLDGTPFEGRVSRGEGAYRMQVPRRLLDQVGLSHGQEVQVVMEPGQAPSVTIPAELQQVLDEESGLATTFDGLAPSCRRAWATHVAEAKRPETRMRRAQAAREGIRKKAYP